VLGKVASIVQKNLSNLQAVGGGLAGLAGGLGGALFDKAKNSIQTNAAAAKILNKSPLELGDTSPMSHMKQNPYEYGTVFYPNDVQNLGTGHYMFFDILETTTVGAALGSLMKLGAEKALKALGDDSAAAQVGAGQLTGGKSATFKNGKSRIQSTSSGINAGGGRHTRVVDSIILYTPAGLKTTYTVSHSGKETGILGDIAGLGSSKNPLEAAARLGEITTKVGVAVVDGITQMAQLGDFKSTLQKLTGRAFNNNLEMVFEGVPMREFSFEFEFVPKNRKELDSARKIISLFKFHMHPELGYSNDFVVPSQFQITYMYIDKQNTYIPRISKCVCTKLDLQHGDESIFSTFAGDELGAAPIYTKMSLNFSETEIMTKQKIAEGY
jgi:hypothetical protein